ncbi:MATE family efflux transporter [Donghicola mangrovi]|uniref:Multidrug-efflux transporter n=1 Tax=Donghicola mangrovi TaxID=2729614 RepID=A0A850QAB9_9RHOB|nr:MATE family efflux transporter [Donghicola mangrovi]NVO23425.1 MATE family efflux transporter [Donghicola mangrovi]
MIKNPALPYSTHFRATLLLGLPLIGGHLAQFAVWATDTLMVGRYGVEELAAVVLATSLMMTLFIFGSGFAWAVMPLVAASQAEGDDVAVRRQTRMGLWLSTLFGLACLPALIWSKPILVAIGQEPDLAALAQDYLRIAGWGILPGLFVNVMKSYLAALERTAVVLWITVAAALTNAVVNYALIFGHWGAPEMGVRGAAVASVLVQVVSLIGCVWYARVVLPQHALFQRMWRPDWDVFLTVFKLGVPIGFTALSEVALFAFAAVVMGWLGAVPLAAHGIVLQVATATFMIHMGLSNAATVRAGTSFGRKDSANLKRAAIAAMSLSFCVSVVAVLAMLIYPEELIMLFMREDEVQIQAILTVGVTLMGMAALFQFVDATQVLAIGLLRGLQDTTKPMWFAGFSYWIVGAPMGLLLSMQMGWGAQGVWMGLVLGLASAAVLLMGRFWLFSLPRIREEEAALPLEATEAA